MGMPIQMLRHREIEPSTVLPAMMLREVIGALAERVV